MDAYRKKPIPVIYTQLGFVRASAPGILADCPDDIVLLNQLQKVAADIVCVSALEYPHQLILKIELPDDILTRTGTSGDVIKWHCYYWKLWDAESLVTGIEPAEAIHPANAGIDGHFLNSLAHPTSCLPQLRTVEEAFDNGERKGYTLSPEITAQLKQKEKQLIARLKLTALKELKPTTKPNFAKSHADPVVSVTLRDEIMRRDNYRCMFCGQDSSVATLEVNHIIPRSVIKKLHLDARLQTAPENLCVTCFKCNRGKSDHLAPEDIAYYMNAFGNTQHPNHGVLRHLATIRQLQTM